MRSAISQLNKDISALEDQIAAETDPVKKAQLQAVLDQKNNYSDELTNSLDAMKTLLKSENLDFNVLPDPTNSNYPYITSVSPGAVPTGKRIRTTITGQNFGANPNVKIGGQNSTIISASASSIVVLAPNFSIEGAKDIEIAFPADSTAGLPRKNAVLTSSFFASNLAILKNIRPVAVTTGYVRGVWPITAPVVLTASNSYDENGDTFSYEWTFQKSPTGSVFTTGT
ncbi:MAG: IPT/TIG domain-containing protein, partial [Pseudobdellovibrio sp.]